MPPPDEPVFRLSVEQYHNMISAGILTDDDPVELLEGVLVFKMPKNPPHETALGKCQDELPSAVPRGWIVRLQAPVTLSDSEPEPDVAIVRGARDDYRDRHPGPRDIAMLIEIADTTLERDRGMKLRAYARAGITQYCILDLAGRSAELYVEPQPDADEPRYAEPSVIREAGEISFRVGDATVAVALSRLLP
jgi:Uma2 family endonuclease